MSKAKARIIARCIYRGTKKLSDVAKADQAIVKAEYGLLFGEELK